MAATRSVLPLIGRSGLRLEGHASLLIHKEFYVCSAVRAEQTRAAHLLLRMSLGHSRCALTASPHNASSTHRFPRYMHCNVEGYRHFEKHPVSYDIECFKMAATYSPTTQCSTIGDAGCVGARAALPRPSAPASACTPRL